MSCTGNITQSQGKSRSFPKALTQCRHQCTPTVKNAPAFAFDLIKPERPQIDRAVLDFVKGQVFIRTDGVCRLNPEMARMVVARVSRSKLVGRNRACARVGWTEIESRPSELRIVTRYNLRSAGKASGDKAKQRRRALLI
jgi:hypothetical protein